MNRNKILKIWQEMKNRCDNIQHPLYKKYGGNGIGYPSSWEDFESFYADMKTAYPNSLVLRRVDDTADFSKANCYWKDILNPDIDVENYHEPEKSINEKKKLEKYYAYNGMINDIAGFSTLYNINYFTLQKRLSRGWNIEEALTRSVREREENRQKKEQ